MDKTYLLLVVAIIAVGSLLAVSAQVPEPPLPMDEGMITITPLNNGAMVMSSMSGNTTVNIEVHPPDEEKETVDVVVIDYKNMKLTCASGTTHNVRINHFEEDWGRYYNQPDSSMMFSNDRIVDHGSLIANSASDEYVIFELTLNDNMTEFEGTGVIFSDETDQICGEDYMFPIRMSGTCGAGTSFMNGTVSTYTPGTFLIEGLSSAGYNITGEVPTYTYSDRAGKFVEATPQFYSYCYSE